VVTSHGNDYYNDIEHPQYPAAYDEVISVGSSTPDDRRKSPGDSWNTAGAWGTNYGALLDITAPGVCIFTTDLSGADGYSTTDYVAFQKTSASAPIVSGVAALVLSKSPDMSWQEVRTRLSESADKTNNSATGGGYNYSYDQYKPGHSMEMGYGRVNAEKAVSDGTVGTEPALAQSNTRFTVTPLVTATLDIRYTIEGSSRFYEMAIIDMSGKLLLNAMLPAGHGSMNFDVSNLSPGMYIVKCSNGFEVVSTDKFVKVR
jgi:subtilisin family serine protease